MSSTSAPARELVPKLSSSLRQRLALPRALAREENARLFLAGGAVRDLFLGREVKDLDLVVEGDALGLAERLARRTGGRARLHRRFGTATVETLGGERLDLAAARRETYARPGALPRVRPGSIEDDLERRDFTINAMALELAPTPRPRLLDPFGGRRDLEKRVIRMLHPRSPTDDPTRAFRAARYANRLGFSIDRETRRWILAAVAAGSARWVSGDRIRREVRLIFSEPNRAPAVRILGELGLTEVVHPELRADAAMRKRLTTAERLATAAAGATTWFLYLLVWACELAPAAAQALSARLNLERGQRRALSAWPATRKELSGLSDAWLPRRRLSADEISAAAACGDPADRGILARRLSAGEADLTIRGRDLLAAGVPAGPAIGRALERTRTALELGRIRREQELEFALEAARSEDR